MKEGERERLRIVSQKGDGAEKSELERNRSTSVSGFG